MAQTIRSAIEGLAWPAVPGRTGRLQLALLYQLEESQWWPAEVLQEHQFRQLNTLLDHAARTVPFYRKRLGAAGFPGAPAITPESWRKIPVLTRREVQRSFEALRSRALPKAHGRTGEALTTGSTATPVRTVSTELGMGFWLTLMLRENLWHGRDMGGKLALIRPVDGPGARYPRGARSAHWGPARDGAFATGPRVTLEISSKIDEQAEWLLRQDPDYLVTYPSNLAALVHHCEERGMVPGNLRGVRTMSEILYPEVREACRRVWGVPVTDAYSTEEVGHIAFQCPESENLHVQAETVLVEVLDDAGSACAPGEVGRVVVTPLHNFAMPLIRYAVGDLAEVGAPCPCGRGLPVLRRIIGRIRSMVRLPSGGQLYANFHGLLAGIGPVVQFQIVRTGEEELEMRLVAKRELTAAERETLTARIRERFRYSFRIAFAYVDEIPRGPGGKFQDYRSEIE